MRQDVRQRALQARKRPVAQVVVQFHVAQCRKSVEPGVSHGFHGLAKSIFLDAGNQLLTLAMDFDGPGLAGDDCGIALGLAGNHLQLARLF